MLLMGIGTMGYIKLSSHNPLAASPLRGLYKLSVNYRMHTCTMS